jgi:hypothetical protein
MARVFGSVGERSLERPARQIAQVRELYPEAATLKVV